MTYEQLVDALLAQNEFAIKYDLDAMHVAVHALGVTRTARASVIVGGTNGKGGTSALLHGIARAAGWRVGLFTSPHLVDIRERIRIDGEPVGRDAFRDAGAEMLQRFGGRGQPPETPRALSYFELVALIAARCFTDQREPLDLAIWEVGLGGRLDATNAFVHDVAVVTSVALDHQQFLGDSVTSIAREKVAIARPGTQLITHRAADGAAAILEAASHQGSGVRWTGADGDGVEQMNAALATDAARVIADLGDLPLGDATIARGLANARWPGRRQVLASAGRTWLVDGGHNPAATLRVATWLSQVLDPGEKLPAIVAASPGRDLAAVYAPLAPYIGSATCVPASASRSVAPVELASALHGIGVDATACDHAEQAFAAAEPGARTLVLGSLYLAGALFGWLGMDADDLSVYADDPGN